MAKNERLNEEATLNNNLDSATLKRIDKNFKAGQGKANTRNKANKN